MINCTVTINNKLGLHARASTKLVHTAARFQSDVQLRYQGKQVNAKRIMDVMLLAATQGAQIEIIADGDDETEACDALFHLVNHQFYENKSPTCSD